jgi:hypothetical protein
MMTSSGPADDFSPISGSGQYPAVESLKNSHDFTQQRGSAGSIGRERERKRRERRARKRKDRY